MQTPRFGQLGEIRIKEDQLVPGMYGAFISKNYSPYAGEKKVGGFLCGVRGRGVEPVDAVADCLLQMLDKTMVWNAMSPKHRVEIYVPPNARVDAAGRVFVSDEEIVEDEGGNHYDDDKPRVDLVPIQLILGAGRALGDGAEKYGADNFRKGIRTRRIAGSLVRHTLAWIDGEDLDEESGLDHLDHAAANLGMLMWTLDNRPDLDDRWRGDNSGIKEEGT